MGRSVEGRLEQDMPKSSYIRENKGYSFLHLPRELCAAFVLLWGINPESFLYNWALYAGVVVLWACFAMASDWIHFWKTVLHPGMLLSFGWPVLLAVYAVLALRACFGGTHIQSAAVLFYGLKRYRNVLCFGNGTFYL